MKITICGSIAFYEELQILKSNLEQMGHSVDLPPSQIQDENGRLIPIKEYYGRRKAERSEKSWVWERKNQAMRLHFDKVAWADAILVANYDKNGIKNYIGPNSLLEMGIAMHLGKKIFLLNPIPEMDYKEEILGMGTIALNNDLSRLK